MAELKDAVEDINEVMGGLSTTDQFDEDDLLEELELMQQETQEEAAPEVAHVTATAEVEPHIPVGGGATAASTS